MTNNDLLRTLCLLRDSIILQLKGGTGEVLYCLFLTWRAKASPSVLSGPAARWDYSTSTPSRIRQTQRYENQGPLSYLQKSVPSNFSNSFPHPMHWVSNFSVLRIIPCIVRLKAELLGLSESQTSVVGWQTTQDCPDCPIWVSSTTSWEQLSSGPTSPRGHPTPM